MADRPYLPIYPHRTCEVPCNLNVFFHQFLAWIEALSPKQSPVWLGLPDAAENVILTTQGTKTRMKMMRMQQIDDDDEDEGGIS